jgi:Spy/CpxP family protein refolding chaperone
MNKLSKAIILVAIVGVVGFAATSFAGWGRGGGYCRGQGGGGGQRWSGPAGYQSNLSDEEIIKLNQQRQAFLEETRAIRENLYQKDLELRSEMAKKDPDATKAVGLQKEISELEGQLDQKRVEQRIKMQKENPEIFTGRGYGQGRGYGKGRGYGMDRGFRMGQGYGMRRGSLDCGGGCWEKGQ